MIQMKVELKGVKEALEMYDPKKVRQAIRSTLDKTMTFMKKRLITLITEKYNVPATEVRKVISTVRTTMAELVATLNLKGKRIPMVLFPHADIKPGGVVVSMIARKSFVMPHSFEAKMSIGHVGIFKRLNKFKYKIFPNVKHRNSAGVRRQIIGQKMGPSVPEIIGSEGFKPRVEKEAGDYMEKLFIEEIEKRIYKGSMGPQWETPKAGK